MVDEAQAFRETLLDCIGQFAEFLLEAEIDAICSAKRHTRSAGRLNFRAGYHSRMLKLRVGTLRIRVPHVRVLHARPAMTKRFKRLETLLVGTLDTALRQGADISCVAELINQLWTLEITPEKLAAVTADAVTLLDKCKRAFVLREAMEHYSKVKGIPLTGTALGSQASGPQNSAARPLANHSVVVPFPLARPAATPPAAEPNGATPAAYAYSVY